MSEHWCACGEDINGHEWQVAAKRHLDLATEYRLRAEQAEAAIARVREVCADQCFWAEHGPDAGLVNAVTVESILDALEGDSEQ